MLEALVITYVCCSLTTIFFLARISAQLKAGLEQ